MTSYGITLNPSSWARTSNVQIIYQINIRPRRLYTNSRATHTVSVLIEAYPLDYVQMSFKPKRKLLTKVVSFHFTDTCRNNDDGKHRPAQRGWVC